MKKVINFPCSNCKKLTNGNIIAFQEVSENLTIVRFSKECCKRNYVGYFSKLDISHYIKEVK
jgi:hypothetical protein